MNGICVIITSRRKLKSKLLLNWGQSRIFSVLLSYLNFAGTGLPLVPGQALPFATKKRKQRFAKGESFDSLPLGTPSGRPKALPLETRREAPALVLFHAQARPACEVNA